MHRMTTAGRPSWTGALARRTATLALCLSWVGAPAWPGSLAVTGDAAYEGSYGLEVTLGSSCTADEDAVLESHTVTGSEPFEGCSSITAGNGFVVAGGGAATFTAGRWIALSNGFSVAAGGAFTAVIDATLTPFAWVRDDSPSSETTFNVKLHVNLDLLTIGSGDRIVHFVASRGNGDEQLRLVITSGPSFALEVRDGTGAYTSTSTVTASSGWNEVDIAWAAAPAAVVSLTVNGGTPVQVTANTATLRIDSVRWGAVDGSVAGSSGILMQDEFLSWR